MDISVEFRGIGPVTGKLVRENFGPGDQNAMEFWSPGPKFSGKIGPPLKILVLQWTNFPWNFGPGGPFFSGKIGPGDQFFQGKLVRGGTIFFREFWSRDQFSIRNFGPP